MEEAVPKGKTKFTSGGVTFIIDSRYELIEIINHSSRGVTISAMDRKENRKVSIQKIQLEDPDESKNILREIKLLSFFNHENIIELLDIHYIYPDNDLYLVTELMQTDLHQVIKSRTELTNEHVQYFMYQLLRGIFYMHSADVIHWDLKPANILINSRCDLKICGLKLSKDCKKAVKVNEEICARWYRSPELMLNSSIYSKKVDIWSCGCILAEFLGRSTLFPNSGSIDFINRIIQQLGTPSPDDIVFIDNPKAKLYIDNLPNREKTSWSNIYPKADPLALDLLDKMIVINPEKRWAVSHCLEHPYFKDLHDLADEPTARESFNWDFENCELEIGAIKNLVYEEASKF